MKQKIFGLILIFLICNCKENPDNTKPKVEEPIQKTAAIAKLPNIIMELAEFADPNFTESTNINDLLLFKAIEENGTVESITMESALDLYKAMRKPVPVTVMPIFEIKNTETSILPIQGRGFGGALWAKVLVNRNTLEIIKVAFEHKAESDEYAAALTQDSFQNQFVGAKISFEEKTFTLQKADDGGRIIDGISGATVTSQGAVDMMNEGLQKYRNYFSQN
jgi:Na+-transporting NADH:ubiquinone oxidoreductase subunit C